MIPHEQLAAYLDDSLDDAGRAALEQELKVDDEALRFVVEQRAVERVLRSALVPAARRQRLKQSVLAAIAATPAQQLRARVIAEIAGVRSEAPARSNTVTPPDEATSDRPKRGILDRLGECWRHLIVLSTGGKARTWALAAMATVAVALALSLRIGDVGRTYGLGAQVGVLAEVVGAPSLRHGQGPAVIEAVRGTLVRLGDRLETGDADRAEIRFRDGTVLRLAFNTTIELPSGSTNRQPDSAPLLRPAEVLLRQGHVWTKVAKLTNAPAYSIRTDAATAIARGTEFGVKLQRLAGVATNPPFAIRDSRFAAVLTVKEGAVDFTNALGSVQATAMTESTARADAAPTEPRRIDTLQTVQLPTGATWALMTSPLDWPEAATKLVGGGGTLGWQLRELPAADGTPEVRVAQLASGSPAAKTGLRVGDTLVALDERPLTHPQTLARAALLRPGDTLNLRVRRETGEETLAAVVAPASPILRAPSLSSDSQTLIRERLGRWLAEPAGANLGPTTESRRIDEAAAVSRIPEIRAAAFNQLGVAFELEDSFGTAIRAYGRAVYLEPQVPLYRFNLALALRKIGSFERAHEELREVARLEPESMAARKRLAEVTSLLGRHEEALTETDALLQAASDDHGLWELRSQLLLKLGRPADAIAPARRAAELDPDCPVAHSYLAEAYHAAGRLPEALAARNEALERAPYEAVLHVNLGALHRDLGQAADAAQSFRRAIELRPDFALAQRNLGEALNDQRDLAAAAQAFNNAAQLEPADAEARVRLGDVSLQRRQFTAAERAYRDALDVAPHHVNAWYGLGEACRQQGRSADAERAYRKAIELQPGHTASHTALGVVFYDRGDVAEAERLYRRAIELDPREAAPYHNLGNLFRETRGDLDAAERWFRQALDRAPEDGDSLGGLGLVAQDRRDLAEAERLLRRAVDQKPDSSALHNNLGEVLRQRGRLDEAEPQYRKALELDPSNPSPYGNLGILQAERKQFAEAEKTFRSLLERSTGNRRLPALINLANVCAEQAKLDEAERLLRQALQLAPDHPRVAQAVASFLADHRRQLDEALALATRAVQSAPENPVFLDTLGWVQAQRGELDTAERTLRRALELAGKEPPGDGIRKHLRQVGEIRSSTTNRTKPTEP